MVSSVLTQTDSLPQAYPQRKRFTVHDFHTMIEAGMFHEDDRLELVDGEILEMTPIGRKHVVCVRRLTTFFARNLPEDVFLDVQNPLSLTEEREYYPDLMLLRTTANRDEDIAAPDDVLLAVEVSDSTLRFDRTVKLPSYAEAGMPEVWIVDLQQERILVHCDPLDGVYGQVEEIKKTDKLTVKALGDAELTVADIFL